jgi:branched-chain amino acid transport system permease protein
MITPGRALAIVGLLAIAVWPLAVQDVFLQRVGALVLLAAISASAWNLLGGYAGQVSVGHALYFGVGAYAGLVVYTEWGWPPIAGAPLGVAVSAMLAIVVGLPTFRLRGHYFSMATIAAAELARILAANWPLLGAAVGLMGPPRPRTIADLSFTSPVPYHYLFLAVLLALLGLTALMQRSRMGYYLAAIRGGDRAARSLGVPVLRYKLYALLLSASFTSIAGTLYAVMVGFVDPDSVLGILVSVKMIIIAALGGAGTLYGPLVGATILIPLEETTNALLGGGGTGITYIIYGAIIVFVARFQPGGVAALWRHAAAWRARRAARGTHAA